MVGLAGRAAGILLPDDDVRHLPAGGSGHQPRLHGLRVVVSGRIGPGTEGRLAADRSRHRVVRHALGQHHALDDVAGRPRLLRDALERLPLGLTAAEAGAPEFPSPGEPGEGLRTDDGAVDGTTEHWRRTGTGGAAACDAV